MRNILLLKGVTAYDAGANYIDEWAAAIRKLGCNTCVLDGWSLAMPKWYNYIVSTYKFDAMIDCNGNLMSYGVPANLPPEVIYGTFLHDHPGGLERLKYADNRTIVFNCDNRFCDYIDNYIPEVRHREFIPLSGSFYPECVPYEKRTIDLIFTGGYRDPGETRNQILTDYKMKGGNLGFMLDILDDIIVNPQYTFPECLSRVLKKHDLVMGDEEFSKFVRQHLLVDYYAREFYRDKIIRVLLASGLKLHVFGAGWDDFHSEHKKNLIIHKGGIYAARKAVAEAKIALNVMPWFKEGFQERIASAMLNKVIAVTDESKYITDNFEDGKELVVFSLKEIETLPERIRYLLENPSAAAQIAESGYKKIQNHTWYHRVYEMLKKMEEHFGIRFIQEGEGRELELEAGFPDKRTAVLEAVYELQKLVAFSEENAGTMDKLSEIDVKLLLNKFDEIARKFYRNLDGVEMSRYIRECMDQPNTDMQGNLPELFSMQCRALMGKLLLDEKGVKL